MVYLPHHSLKIYHLHLRRDPWFHYYLQCKRKKAQYLIPVTMILQSSHFNIFLKFLDPAPANYPNTTLSLALTDLTRVSVQREEGKSSEGQSAPGGTQLLLYLLHPCFSTFLYSSGAQISSYSPDTQIWGLSTPHRPILHVILPNFKITGHVYPGSPPLRKNFTQVQAKQHHQQ